MAGVATGLVAVALVLGLRAPANTANALPSTSVPAPPKSALAQPPVPSFTPSPAPSVAPVPAPPHAVLVSVDPSDATIVRDGNNLGTSPVLLSLADGEIANLVVTRRGFKEKAVPVDISKPKVMVKLDPTFVGGGGRGGGPSPKPTATGGGGIDDVGDPFSNKH